MLIIFFVNCKLFMCFMFVLGRLYGKINKAVVCYDKTAEARITRFLL